MPIFRKPRRHPRLFRPAPLPAALAAIGFCSLLFGAAANAQQLPSGGSVVSGSATIQNTSPTQQLITQGSDKAIIDWQGFSIGHGNSVRFAQPGTGSVVLNRVVGNDPSAIFGSLSANGQVFLVNPQGIYFSPGASLDVGGLVASTLNIRNEDFLAGRYIFNRDPASPSLASVINDGLIRARDGGYVVLAGDYAANRGVVEARLGTVALASGAKVTLDMQGDSLINLAVNEKTVADLAGVANSGELNAEGGRVMMTAAVARDLAGTVVNNTGTVRATGTVEKDGAIYLVGDGGDVSAGGSLNVSGARGGTVKIKSTATTLVSGKVDASGSAGKGGSVQVLGERAGLINSAAINASGASGGGTVLVGGDYQGKNPNVQNSQRTYVGADTTIRADATQNGDGGKVIVWADDVTRFAGHISARGGASGGNGGFAEVSGKESLVYQGSADLRAPQGATGTLLLDPKNIRITAAGADPVVGNSLFADNAAGTSDLSEANVVAALGTADLVLQANNDITVETNIDVTAGGAGTVNKNLTLEAGRHIILASAPNTTTPNLSTGAVAVTMNGGAFSATNNVDAVTFPTFQQANRDAGAAEFFMATGSSITNAGSVTIAAGTNANPVSLNDNAGEFNIGTISTTGGAINISASHNVNINSSLTSNNGTINIASDGTLTIASTGSVNAGAGTATLQANLVLSGRGEPDIKLAGNITAAKVVLDASDDISQTTGGITATQLRVMAAAGTADGSVDLGGNNNVGTLAAAKSTVIPGSGGIYNFNFNNGANALTIGTVDAVSGITASPFGNVAGDNSSVTLTAGDLNINQPVVATGVGTGIGTVTLQPVAGTSVNVGTNTGFGLTQADLDQVTTGALRIGTTAGAGALTINGAITNGPGWDTLILRSGSGGITQSQALTVTKLGIESSGNVTLNNAGNDADIIAASLTGAGALQFTDSDTLVVGQIAAQNDGTPGTPVPTVTIDGITTSNTNATLNTGDAITVNRNINVGSGVLTLNVTQNGASQGPGSVITTTGAGGVRLLGNLANTNNFNLNQNNDITNLAASVNGSVTFRNAGAGTLTVDTVGGTSGISTTGSVVTLIADEMAFNQNINAGAGSVTLTSATPARAISLGTDTTGLNFSDATLERVVTSNTLTIGDNAHSGAITVSGETVNPSQATGGITLRNIDSSININSVLNAGASSVTLVADGGDPTTAASGVITQGAGGGIVANTLTTSSKGGTTLNSIANHAVSNFSAFESGGSDIQFANTGNLAVNGIGLGADDNVRHVTIDTSGTMTANGLITTQATNSNVTLSSGGTMNLTQDVNPGGTGTLTLRSSGSATLTGKVVANANSGGGSVANLLLERRGGAGSGAFTLNNAANDVVNIAADISGALAYTDANALEVDTVGAVNGINTNGNAVTLITPVNIVLNQSVTASGAIVDITAAGISSAGGAGVTASGLALRDNNIASAGSYTLNGSNDITNLATLVNGALTYTDSNSFNVSAVNGVNGINTTGGNVTLSGSSMGISGNITSGAAIALTTTGGGINQSGGAITGNTLQVNSAGAVTLGQGGNNVNIFAASANGAVTYTDANTLTIGSVGGTNGITSNGNNISVTGTRLLVNQHVNAGTGAVTLTTLETAAGNDDIVLDATPDVLTGTTVRLVSADAINHIAGNINATNLFTQAESGNNVAATVAGEYWIDVAGTASFNQNVAANRVVIWSSTGSTTTTQTGGAITANELVFLGRNGDPVFNFNQANNVSTLAASNDYVGFLWLPASTTISFTNTAALNVGLINTNSFTGSVQGITSNNANVTLNTAGALTLNEKINAGTGTVDLTAATGGITQSAFAPVTANFLNISSPGGAVNLGLANNNLLALNNVSVSGSSFSFKEVNNVELRGAINVSNAGPVNVNVTAAGNLDMTGTGSISAVSTGNVAAANVTLNGSSRVSLTGPITATGGGAGSGVNAGVNLLSANGPITMNFGAGIFATDNGPATAAGVAPHSAEVVMTSGSRSAWVANCAFNDVCISTAGNVVATSNNGRAVIDIFGQGDAGDGVRVVGALTATGQTRPLIKLDALTKDSDGNELTSTGNVTVSAPVTVNSTSSTAVNTLANSVIGGISVSGRNITINSKIESRHSDGVSRAQDGISIENVRQNININADIVTSSNGGIGITTGDNGTISGNGVIQAQNVNLVAPKSKGNFNVKTRIQPPAGFAGSGNLNLLGGDVMVIDNLSSTPLIAALGFIDRSQDPVNPDLPIGDLTLKTAGSLQIATLDAYNQQRRDRNGFFGPLVPVKIELVSDNFIVFPGTISTPDWAEITLRPYTNTTEIFVRNNDTGGLPGVVYTAAPITGLLQQFHPDAKLIIGGPNHRGSVTVGGDGLFTLGNMHLVFETGPGNTVKNFFSSDGNVFHPEPVIPFGAIGYPGPNVTDGIGKLTTDRVQLIEAGNFQPNPGVTINGSCPAPCPGGSPGQGAITVTGGSTTGGSGSGSTGGGGGGGGGGGTSSGGTDLGGPGPDGTGSAAGTGGTGGGGSTTPADTTGSGGGTGGDTSGGGGGGVVADGGGSLSGPGDGTVTTTTSTDSTPTEDGGGIIAGDGTSGPGDGTTTGGDPSDPFSGGGGGGGTLAGDPGGTTGDGTGTGPDGGGSITDGSGPGDGSTGLAGGGSGDGTSGGSGSGVGSDGSGSGTSGTGTGDGSDTFGGGGSGGGLAGDTSGAGGDGVSGGSGSGGLGGDGATGGSSLADGSGSGATGGGSGGAGDGTTAGAGGDGSLSGGASGGGLAGDGSGTGGSGVAGGDGAGGSDGFAGGATGGGGLADGSGSGGTGGAGSSSGDSAVAGAGGDGSLSGGASGGGLAGDGSGTGGDAIAGTGTGGGGSAAGDGGDGSAGGATGGGSLADGSGSGSGAGGSSSGDGAVAGAGGDGSLSGGASGSGLAGDGGSGDTGGGFAGADGTSGSSGGGIAGGGDGLAGGATGGGALAGDGSSSGGGSGFAGADGTSGGSGDGIAGGGDGLSGGATGGGSLAGDGSSSGGGSGFAGADGTSGGSGGGSALAGDGSSGGGAGFAGADGSGSGAGSGFAGAGSSGDGNNAGTGDSNVASSGPGLSGELRGGASGGSVSTDGGEADSRSPDAVRQDGDIVARSGSDTSAGFRGGASGGKATGDAGEESGRAGDRADDGKSGERDRYFEDERDAQRIRLVGGNRLISVQGEGVNLHHGDHVAPAAVSR